MEQQLRVLCAREVPGDTHRNLRIEPHYSGETFKHILVPVWLLTYDYGRRTFQVLANAVTGRLAGRYPKSWVKILLLVLAVAFQKPWALLERRMPKHRSLAAALLTVAGTVWA